MPPPPRPISAMLLLRPPTCTPLYQHQRRALNQNRPASSKGPSMLAPLITPRHQRPPSSHQNIPFRDPFMPVHLTTSPGCRNHPSSQSQQPGYLPQPPGPTRHYHLAPYQDGPWPLSIGHQTQYLSIGFRQENLPQVSQPPCR